MKRDANKLMVFAVMMTVMVGACSTKTPPVARPMPPPPPATGGGDSLPPRPPTPVIEPPVVVPTMPADDSISGKSLDDLNRDSPLKPLFFALDSADVSEDGQKVLHENATLLKKYPTWSITVEGHCDERGTAEYNLALGERRALAAKSYLVSLGLPADKIRVVSYGKEFPFEPGHVDEAWSKNRRAHFVITAK